MRRPSWITGVTAAAVLLASAGAGVGAWAWARGSGGHLPEISAYSRGTTIQVEPFLYCNVVDLRDCERPGTTGVLEVDNRNPVQLSVPSAIAGAPWRLLKVYEDERNSTATSYRPDTTLAVRIPTIDPQRGRLAGFVVQLLTLVQDETGALRDLPHAEWTVQLVFSG